MVEARQPGHSPGSGSSVPQRGEGRSKAKAWLEIQCLQERLESACLRWMEADMEIGSTDAELEAPDRLEGAGRWEWTEQPWGRPCGAGGHKQVIEPRHGSLWRKALLVVPPEDVSDGWSLLEGRFDANPGDAGPHRVVCQDGPAAHSYGTLDDVLAAARRRLAEMAADERPDIRSDFGSFVEALLARAERNGQTRESVIARLQDYLDRRAGLDGRPSV